MDVLVVRHGIALDREEAVMRGVPDADRPLTDKGRRRLRGVARGLASLVPRVELIASSPLRRAVETARALGRVFDASRAESRLLVPGADPEALFGFLAATPADLPICVVGHEPHLGEWVALSLFGQSRVAIDLKKGGACLVRFDGLPRAGTGRMEWLVSSGILRRL